MTVLTPDRVVPFGDFLEFLRRQGFPIGLDHHVRLQSLLEAIEGECGPDRLKTLLCPIVATSQDQQEHFYRAFEQFYPLFTPLPAGTIGKGGDAGDLRPSRPVHSARRKALSVAGGLLAVALAVGVVWRFRPQSAKPAPQSSQPDSSRPSDSAFTAAPSGPNAAAPTADTSPALPPGAVQIQAPAPAPEPEPPPVTESFGQRHSALLRALAVSLPLLLFGLNEWRLYRRRRLVIQRQRREKPPFVWPIRVAQPTNPFADSAELHFAARLMRERERGESVRLAVDESVTATIEAMGFPTLRFRSDTRPPDYLVLIERTAFRDHAARLFNDLGRALEHEGVHVTRYYYDGDPRICYPESGGDRMLLVDLRRRYPTYRLLVFGNGEALIDPITGRLHPWTSEFLSWNERALLTPEAPRGWGRREVALAGHFIVLPATVQGLLALVEHFGTPIRPNLRAWRDRSTEPLPPSAVAAEIRDLRTYLGERPFKWLTACAVYPELHWDLTLHLGQLAAMPGELVTEQNLLRLLRLPWFRAGSLPDDLRSALMTELDPETEHAVRTAIVDLLESDPAPGDSVASNQYDLELVVQRLALNRDDRHRRRELLKQVQALPRQQVMQDFAVLQLLERVPSSRLAMMLPGRLREVFFKNGIPALGTRFAGRGGVTLLVTLLSIVSVASMTRSAVVAPWSLTIQGYPRIQDTIFLIPTEERELSARVLPNASLPPDSVKAAQAANASVVFSSLDPSVVMADSSGRIRALRPGVTSIRASAMQQVTVELRAVVAPAQLAFPWDTLRLTRGDSLTIPVIVPSQHARRLLDSGHLAWRSNNTAVIRVGPDGNLESQKIGRATVTVEGFGQQQQLPVIVAATAQARDTSATTPPVRATPSTHVTVSEPIIAAVRVFPESLNLVAGAARPVTLIARAFDASGTFIPSASFVYAASDAGLIRILPDGTIAPLSDTGHTIIVVTSGSVRVSVPVIVRSSKSNRPTLDLEPSRLVLKVGEQAKVTPHFSIADESGKRVPVSLPVLWRSADPSVATVAADGTVLAASVGRTTISAGDSAGFLAALDVEVQPAAAPAAPAPAEPVLDAAALTAIGARVDAAIAALGAGRLSDPTLHLVYPGPDASGQQKVRDKFAALFRDFDYVARPATRDPPHAVEGRVEQGFQIPFEWHDSFGRRVKRTASFRASLVRAADGGWEVTEVGLLQAFP